MKDYPDDIEHKVLTTVVTIANRIGRNTGLREKYPDFYDEYSLQSKSDAPANAHVRAVFKRFRSIDRQRIVRDNVEYAELGEPVG